MDRALWKERMDGVFQQCSNWPRTTRHKETTTRVRLKRHHPLLYLQSASIVISNRKSAISVVLPLGKWSIVDHQMIL